MVINPQETREGKEGKDRRTRREQEGGEGRRRQEKGRRGKGTRDMVRHGVHTEHPSYVRHDCIGLFTN